MSLEPPPRTTWRAITTLTVALALAGTLVFVPLGPWLIMALWFASMARPLLARLGRAMGGRHRAAAVLVLVLFIALLAPCIVIFVSITTEAIDLARRIGSSDTGRAALRAIVSTDGPPSGDSSQLGGIPLTPSGVLDLIQEHGARAWTIVMTAAGAATNVAVGLFVFFWGAFVALSDGPKAYAWMEARTPISREHFGRLASAFNETGRGLFVGVGLSGLVQALVATGAYFALGVPRALVLGLVTFVASLIPTFGCALIWAPVAAGLALSGQTTKAIVLTVIGVAVVGSVDNILRPMFSRWGKLALPSFVIVVSMFGGLALFGGWGLALGPLFVRLAKEALDIAAEEREGRAGGSSAEASARGSSEAEPRAAEPPGVGVRPHTA